jgi:hypothetical protein
MKPSMVKVAATIVLIGGAAERDWQNNHGGENHDDKSLIIDFLPMTYLRALCARNRKQGCGHCLNVAERLRICAPPMRAEES